MNPIRPQPAASCYTTQVADFDILPLYPAVRLFLSQTHKLSGPPWPGVQRVEGVGGKSRWERADGAVALHWVKKNPLIMATREAWPKMGFPDTE